MAYIFRFKDGEEMLSVIQQNIDLYNPSTGQYVFNYNNEGSIAVYSLLDNAAEKLKRLSKETGEYWGANLGPGGRIYDDEEQEEYESYSNLDWCNDNYQGTWENVTVS